MMPAVIASFEGLEEIGKRLNVRAHALVWGAPDHVSFAVLEAESLSALGLYLNSIAIVQDFTIKPVQNLADVVEFGKAAMERAEK